MNTANKGFAVLYQRGLMILTKSMFSLKFENALNDISWFFNNFLKKFSKHLAIENVLIYQVMNIVLVTTHCSGVSNHYTNWHKNSNQSSESQENVTYYMFL